MAGALSRANPTDLTPRRPAKHPAGDSGGDDLPGGRFAGAPLVAIVGPTAVGKSTLALALTVRHGGEIVSCDSAAVYRRLDIGTEKVPPGERQGVPHHLIDEVEPTAHFTAADYVARAVSAIAGIVARGRLPVVVGGTGLYYRALTRGLFPGPSRDAALRRRLERVARRRPRPSLHRMLTRVDPAAAARIHPGDTVRLVRALEVFRLTRRPLTEHFRDTVRPLEGLRIVTIGLSLPAPLLLARIVRRVEQEFARGLLDEVRALLASGVPRDARAFRGIGYHQAIEVVEGRRSEADARAEIIKVTRQFARRQLAWFRHEPDVCWIEAGGETQEALESAEQILREKGVL